MDDSCPSQTHGDATPQDQIKVDQFGAPILDRQKFDCPLCRSIEYLGTEPPFHCSGCTVTFTDPWRFKRLVRRDLDARGEIQERVTRGPDDRPRPNWQRAFADGETPVGVWTKRAVDR